MASEIELFFACCAGRVFLLVLHRFSRFRCQKGVQNGLHFRWHGDPKTDKIRKRHLVPPKTANFLPIGYFFGYRDTQMTPKAVSTASRKRLPEHRSRFHDRDSARRFAMGGRLGTFEERAAKVTERPRAKKARGKLALQQQHWPVQRRLVSSRPPGSGRPLSVEASLRSFRSSSPGVGRINVCITPGAPHAKLHASRRVSPVRRHVDCRAKVAGGSWGTHRPKRAAATVAGVRRRVRNGARCEGRARTRQNGRDRQRRWR